jgi:peptidoglycan/LPS O-acetylase OafA/YrhL
MSAFDTMRSSLPPGSAVTAPAAAGERADAAPDANAATVRRSGARLAWLDALRGFAALCVVFDHATYLVLIPVRNWVYQWFDPGQYGVFVFFLVSGYIVPASLERKGSVRAFWISRAFRLYPLYLLALLASVIGSANGIGNIQGAQHHPLTTAASWLLMIPNILTGPNVPNVAWTLSYEMVFYLVLAALFSWRIHRPSGGYALGCAISAVALGGILPMWWFTRTFRSGSDARTLDLTVDALILGGIAIAVMASGKTSGAGKIAGRIGATIAGLTALTLVAVNQYYPYPWSASTILALMFTGTLIYRAEQGEVSRRKAAVISALVLALTLAAGLWHGQGLGTPYLWQWATSLVLAAATFGAGLAARRRKIPGWLAWLGVVSYSVYLLHPLVLTVFASVAGKVADVSVGMQVFAAFGIVAMVLVVSAVTYYFVEKPMQRAGRWVAARGRG